MILVYGAYGYTGELIARRAAKLGVKVRLAGRREEPLAKLAAALGLPHRAFSLDDNGGFAHELQDVKVVLNCAGPFSRTAMALAQACLAAQVHYLDITGEIAVFEALAALDAQAQAGKVTLLPGAGFDVVPSDCLAAHVAARVPNAKSLRLAFATSSSASHGTATTALENAGGGGWIRREGKLEPVRSGHRRIKVDLGSGPVSAVAIPWGDVATAFHSTGIPNIETFVVLPKLLAWTVALAPMLAWSPVRKVVQARINSGPAGPSEDQRARGESHLYAEVRAADGQVARSRLHTPEAYELTSWTALELAQRAARGELPVGFQTPSRACGADFILSFPGVVREDVA